MLTVSGSTSSNAPHRAQYAQHPLVDDRLGIIEVI
jgi:hypothetical protein